VNNTTNVEEYFKKYQDNIKHQLDESKDSIYNKLVGDTASYCNSIPESLFVNYFLPFFLGNAINENWVLEWISIAGSPMLPIRVFKDGTNETLYMVPGLLNTNNLLAEKGRVGINDIIARYEQYNSNLPIKGVRFLIEALNDKGNEILSNNNLDEVSKVWINILTRYNLVNINNNNSNSEAKSNLTDYLDF